MLDYARMEDAHFAEEEAIVRTGGSADDHQFRTNATDKQRKPGNQLQSPAIPFTRNGEARDSLSATISMS